MQLHSACKMLCIQFAMCIPFGKHWCGWVLKSVSMMLRGVLISVMLQSSHGYMAVRTFSSWLFLWKADARGNCYISMLQSLCQREVTSYCDGWTLLVFSLSSQIMKTLSPPLDREFSQLSPPVGWFWTSASNLNLTLVPHLDLMVQLWLILVKSGGPFFKCHFFAHSANKTQAFYLLLVTRKGHRTTRNTYLARINIHRCNLVKKLSIQYKQWIQNMTKSTSPHSFPRSPNFTRTRTWPIHDKTMRYDMLLLKCRVFKMSFWWQNHALAIPSSGVNVWRSAKASMCKFHLASPPGQAAHKSIFQSLNNLHLLLAH